jgi:hypothetical protein
MLRYIAVENDDVQNAIRHPPASGYAVTNRAKSSPARTTQTLTRAAGVPVGPTRVARITYFRPYAGGSSATASVGRCWVRRCASSCLQSSGEYPSAWKRRL